MQMLTCEAGNESWVTMNQADPSVGMRAVIHHEGLHHLHPLLSGESRWKNGWIHIGKNFGIASQNMIFSDSVP